MTSFNEKELIRKIRESDVFTPDFKSLSKQINYDKYTQKPKLNKNLFKLSLYTKVLIPTLMIFISFIIPLICHSQTKKMIITNDNTCKYTLGGEQSFINVLSRKPDETFELSLFSKDYERFRVKAVIIKYNNKVFVSEMLKKGKYNIIKTDGLFILQPNDIVQVEYEVFDRVNRITSHFTIKVLCYLDDEANVSYKFI